VHTRPDQTSMSFDRAIRKTTTLRVQRKTDEWCFWFGFEMFCETTI
jgi:hypothetical protein